MDSLFSQIKCNPFDKHTTFTRKQQFGIPNLKTHNPRYMVGTIIAISADAQTFGCGRLLTRDRVFVILTVIVKVHAEDQT